MTCNLKIISLLATVLFVGGCGGDNNNGMTAEAEAQELSSNVTVTNDPLNVNLTNTSLPIDIMVSMPPAESREVIGFDETCGVSGVIYTVPAGKIFILTDAILTGGSTIHRDIGGTVKMLLRFVDSAVMSFQSGFEFPPGSKIFYPGGSGCATVSGYLINA